MLSSAESSRVSFITLNNYDRFSAASMIKLIYVIADDSWHDLQKELDFVLSSNIHECPGSQSKDSRGG